MELVDIRIPWKVQQFAKSVFGEDWVYNRASFRPDFSERSFARLSLGTMPPGEFKQQVVELFLQRQETDFLVPVDKVISLANDIADTRPDWRDSILNSASDICGKGLPIYHLLEAPLTGRFPWKSLKSGPNNDLLFRSRPQRFGFAPVLAQAALFDQKYVSLLDEILQGWQQYARTSRFRWPYNSSHAVVYRVIALCFSWTFIGAVHQQNSRPESESVLYRILDILRNDIQFLAPQIGHAFPNNHLLADYFVGWLLHVMFPEFIPDAIDFSNYEKKWQQELLRQFYPDGGSFEHAIHYHEHGCEMAIIYRLLIDKESIPREVDQRIGKILRFQAALNGPFCRPWALGDTTEDTLLPIDASLGWSSHAILAVFNYLYPEQPLPSSGQCDDQKAFWLLAGRRSSPLPTDAQALVLEQYPDSGFTHWVDYKQENELLFRTGVPPQSDLIPGHMHADMLSLFWRVNGNDLLAASGTYTYKYNHHGGENYRDYFSGPWSHSCVVIGGEDPLGSVDADFRRSDNGLRVVSQTLGDAAIGSVCIGNVQSDNSYHGFRRGVLHLPDNFILVFDVLTKVQSDMQVAAVWHFGKDVEVRGESKLELVKDDDVIGNVCYSAGGTLELYKGEVSPIRGWQSDRYGLKSAASCAHVVYPQGRRIFAHILACANNSYDYAIESEVYDQDSAIFNVSCRYGKNIVYLSLCDSGYELKVDNISVSAQAIVHQNRYDEVNTLVLIECRSIIGLDKNHIFENPQTLHLQRKTVNDRWEISR